MEIEVTQDASRRLINQLNYLHEELSYPKEKVIKIEDDLLNSINILKTNPRLGQYEDRLSYLEKGYRRLIVGKFKIIYFIDEDKVYVTNFFDTRRNPSEMKG